MSLILPKGIVVNSPELNGVIERINTEPLDLADIARFWKVYTTTKRRLLDPTAERLENYWWRIWGSRRRELSGAIVARLFAQISDGQSFVPLRGPSNRDEGATPLNRTALHGPGASSAIALHNPNQSRPSTNSSSTTSRAPAAMPHPILKKTRGPSATGPRPTARFISPHESEDDPISSASGTSNVVVRPPSPESQSSKVEKKTASGPSSKKGQGFVASTAGKKKRPVIVRRKSSQSSTETPPRSTETMSSTTLDSSFETTPPNVPGSSHAHNKPPLQSKFQENFSPSSERLSAPLPKKRSATKNDGSKSTSSRKLKSGSRNNQIEDAAGLNPPPSGEDPGPSTLRGIENRQLPETNLEVEDCEEFELQKTLITEANLRLKKGQAAAKNSVLQLQDEQVKALRKSLRSSNQLDSRETGAIRYLSNDTKSTASLASTLAAATGKLDLGGAAEEFRTSESTRTKVDKGKGKDSKDRPSGVFAKRPIPPIAASSTAALPEGSDSLARSKSQLTLLLEKDRTRSGEFIPKDEKKRGKKG